MACYEEGLMRVRINSPLLAVLLSVTLPVLVMARPPSGAIFTTLVDGSEVNFNIYPSKEAVYLDGGPGPGAPATAAGLDDGTYVFQVTDPSGKTLLSLDAAQCRQFVVSGGYIVGVTSDSCHHQTGFDIDHGATTVQLMPYKDTPNPGGVYKVWVTLVSNYACYPDLSKVDCSVRGSKHGFVPADSKTDNFKVATKGVREIDVRFFDDANNSGWQDDGEAFIDNLQTTWVDSVGGSNVKSSYFNLALDVNHEAHIEAPEDGNHRIVVDDQPGCVVGQIYVLGVPQPEWGPQIVSIDVTRRMKDVTLRVDVACTSQP